MAYPGGMIPHMTTRLQPWPNQTTTVEVNTTPYQIYRVTITENYPGMDQRKTFAEFYGYDENGDYAFTGGTITASAEHSSHPKENAFNGVFAGQQWSSNATGSQWVQYDLGVGNEKIVQYAELGINWISAQTNFHAQQFFISASNDGTNFDTLLSVNMGDFVTARNGWWSVEGGPSIARAQYCASFLHSSSNGEQKIISPKFFRWLVTENNGYAYCVVPNIEIYDKNGQLIPAKFAGASHSHSSYLPGRALGRNIAVGDWWGVEVTPSVANPVSFYYMTDDGAEVEAAAYAIWGGIREQERDAPFKKWAFQCSNDCVNWTTLETREDQSDWDLWEKRYYAFGEGPVITDETP